MRFIIALTCCLAAGCSIAANPRSACPLPTQQPFTIVQIFFGRNVPGRGPLTDAEWSSFVAKAITGEFPDGFTVIDGDGQWFDQRTGT